MKMTKPVVENKLYCKNAKINRYNVFGRHASPIYVKK